MGRGELAVRRGGVGNRAQSIAVGDRGALEGGDAVGTRERGRGSLGGFSGWGNNFSWAPTRSGLGIVLAVNRQTSIALKTP